MSDSTQGFPSGMNSPTLLPGLPEILTDKVTED